MARTKTRKELREEEVKKLIRDYWAVIEGENGKDQSREKGEKGIGQRFAEPLEVIR